MRRFFSFFKIFLFILIFPEALSLATFFESQELSLLRKSEKLVDLQEDLKALKEKKETLRACELERELKKIPKACFQLRFVKGLSKEEKKFYTGIAQKLCKDVIRDSNSLVDLKRWEKIPSLGVQCKNLLKVKIELMVYQKEDVGDVN